MITEYRVQFPDKISLADFSLWLLFQQFRDLPHERLANFDKAVDRLSALADHFDDQECDGDNCDMRFYHQARASIRADNSVQNYSKPIQNRDNKSFTNILKKRPESIKAPLSSENNQFDLDFWKFARQKKNSP